MEQSLTDINVVNENIRLFFKQGQRSFEDFDQIILQIQMHVMNEEADI